MSYVEKLMAFEEGTLSEDDIVELFSELVSSGMAWNLQGSYGRFAQGLIESGYLSPQGEILRHSLL